MEIIKELQKKQIELCDAINWHFYADKIGALQLHKLDFKILA